MIRVFAFECNVRGQQWQRIINHATAGKARYDYLLDLREVWPEATFADITVRKVGGPVTSNQFRRNAKYRGMPDVECGAQVMVRWCGAENNERPGVIVGHNDSANFDVLFEDGWIGNVHPSEIRVVAPGAGS